MNTRTRPARRLRPEWLVLPILLTLVAASFGGGFELKAHLPHASAPDDAVLVVRAFGCKQPAEAKIRGTAEGLINGKRHTVQLELEAIDEGVYAVRQQWPGVGTWVLAFTGRYGVHDSGLLVKVTPKGSIALTSEPNPEVQADVLHRKLRASDVESVLASHARKASASTGR